MAEQPSNNQEWLDHWKKKLFEVSETGEKYSIPGAQSHEMPSIETCQKQIEYYEEKLLEDQFNGRQVVVS